MGDVAKAMGQPFAGLVLRGVSNPIAGLFAGMLATSIIQSSSATTSMVVALVASGTLNLEMAIPVIMGANMGTTVTNTLVSLGHITRKDEFRRAFAASTIHDIFNLLSILVVFPLQYYTNFLGILSNNVALVLIGKEAIKFPSPVKIVTAPVVDFFARYVPSIVLMIAFVILLFIGLKLMIDSMKVIMTGRLRRAIDTTFSKPKKSFLTSLTFTAIIQSSSITTSLVVPLAGAGLATTAMVFPYALGANIGTTVTALIAALATGSTIAIAAALAHLFFNVIGICIWYPLKKVPIGISERLADTVQAHGNYAIIYIIIAFFIIPAMAITLLC
ncbi:MAG: Na/Pi symporter [Methanosarcinales archaeon]|nr:MAG: Na/Pi symporter [Methanosarcinales archaeon]